MLSTVDLLVQTSLDQHIFSENIICLLLQNLNEEVNCTILPLKLEFPVAREDVYENKNRPSDPNFIPTFGMVDHGQTLAYRTSLGPSLQP